MKYYLAIDIGASSGRHIVGWTEDGALKTEELYRFPNGVQSQDGHLIWDIEALLSHVKAGIDAALEQFPQIESLSIDTWGCDYVLLRGDEAVLPCYAYRDGRTEEVIPAVHRKMPFFELYAHTGCQFQPFNTVYQLCADLATGRLEGATDFLMVPEYLMYRLTGVKSKEYTNATTTGLVNARTYEYDREIISRLGLPAQLFPALQQPGTEIGSYKGIRVLLCPTHDTASAVEGIDFAADKPMQGASLQAVPYISSGTWSLLGLRTPVALTDERSQAGNWSNEGGVGYNRYQKNIMGMWLVNRLRDELCPGKPFPEIVALAKQSRFDGLVNADGESFLAPERMKDAFDEALEQQPETMGDYFRCAYRSLALSYKNALDELERNTGRKFDRLVIVGGGAKNQFLNDLTAHFTAKQVIALPVEATALGNLKIQMNA